MGKGVKAFFEGVGGAILVVVGIVYDNPALVQFGAALIAGGAATEISARQQIKARNAYNASLRDRYAMVRGTQTARQLVFGRARVSGPMFFVTSYGTDNVHLVICVALAAHEVDAIETIYFDDQPVTLDSDGNVTGTRMQDSFSIAAATAVVTITKTPYAGTVTAVARYGDVLVPLTVTNVSGAAVTVAGAYTGQTGQLDVYYQPNPDPLTPTGLANYNQTFSITSASQTFTLSRTPATGAVHAVYASTSSTSDDAYSVSVAGVSGNNVTISGGDVGRQVKIYYQVSTGPTSAAVRMYTGAAGQNADANLITELPGTWTSAHKASGVAYLIVELTYSDTAFLTGVPNVSAVVRGMKCFDPRTGTSAWTENPALHARALATHPLAGNLPTTCIDDAAISTAASACDVSTSYTVGAAVYTRPLYKAGFAFSVDQKPMDGLTDLCQAMGGSWVFADGTLRVSAGAYRTPNPGTLDETWLTDDQAVQIQVGVARADLVNTLTTSIADEYQDWRVVPLPRLSPDTYTSADGATLSQDIQYAAVTFAGQAQYLNACYLRRMRQGLQLIVSCNMRAWQDERFDVRNVSLARFGWVNKPFEVLSDSWTADGAIVLTLQETAAAIWDMDEGFPANDIAPNTNMPVPWGLLTVTSLTATTGDAVLLRQSDGTVIPRISVSWDAITDPRITEGGGVEIRYWRMGDAEDTFQSVKALGTDTQAYLTGVRDGSLYLIIARTFSVVTQSPWCAQIVQLAEGKSFPPSDVTDPAYALGNGRVHLFWDACTDADYKLTEVRVGSSWAAAAASVIGTPAADALDWLETTAGTYTVWFAHQNWSGVYSTTPTSLSVVIDATVNVTVSKAAVSPATIILQADSNGHVSSSSFSGATATVTVSQGGVDETSSWTYAKVDSGVTSSLSGTDGNVVTISAMPDGTDSGTVTVTASRAGFASDSVTLTIAKTKSAYPTTGPSGLIGNLFANGSASPNTVQAHAGVKFNTTTFIAYRHGLASTGYVDSTKKWDQDSTVTGSYQIRFDILKAPSVGSISGGLGTLLTLDSSTAQGVEYTVTNGSDTAQITYTLFDSTGANQLATGIIGLFAESSD